MKIIHTLFILRFLTLGAFSMSESLEILIKKMNGMEDGEIGYDQRLIDAWPGLESETALNEILDLVLQPGRNENYPEGMNILDSMKFPRGKIVGMILEKVKDRQSPEEGLGRAFGLAQYYTDDPRILSYLINFLNDVRSAGRREPMASADYETVSPRICDCAAEVIRLGLQKRGLLKPGEPAWGEPGGATSYENADKSLLLLKEFLLEKQLMTQEQAVARPKKDTATLNPANNLNSESKTQIRKPKRPGSKDETPNPVSLWLWIVGGAIAVTGPFIWAYLKRRNLQL